MRKFSEKKRNTLSACQTPKKNLRAGRKIAAFGSQRRAGFNFQGVMEHDRCFQGPAHGTFHGLQHLSEALHSSELLKVGLQDRFVDDEEFGV